MKWVLIVPFPIPFRYKNIYADIYQWPHITYFNDFEDLERKLQQVNFNKTHNLMVEELESSKGALFETWCKLIQMVEKSRIVPKSYQSEIIH